LFSDLKPIFSSNVLQGGEVPTETILAVEKQGSGVAVKAQFKHMK
jgi:predicted RNA-binding protein